MRQSAATAFAHRTGLVIFPAMFLTGYNIGEAVFKLAEPVDGQDLARAGTGPALIFADIDLSAIFRSRKENPLSHRPKP